MLRIKMTNLECNRVLRYLDSDFPPSSVGYVQSFSVDVALKFPSENIRPIIFVEITGF